MPKIASISSLTTPYQVPQTDIEQLIREMFEQKAPQLDRLLHVFQSGGITTRQLAVPLDWHKTEHSFADCNRLYTELATQYSIHVIEQCLNNEAFLTTPIAAQDIDAIVFVSSTGIATPSIDARIFNALPFSEHITRIPIWGLGCAGGAAGISRAFEYCKAYPEAKVLVVCVELCSLTFQPNDLSKSNLVGASLFADGAACVLICGDQVSNPSTKRLPSIIRTASKLMPHSEDVMGWDIQNDGFHVIFSKNIPTIITTWLEPFVQQFLDGQSFHHFIAHPGGKKVLEAYEQALQLSDAQTTIARNILHTYGNMSSPTVLYVLEQFMQSEPLNGESGLLAALGPGFSGELVLLQWRD